MDNLHIKLDQTDRKILQKLQQNAKITNSQLAKEIGLSPAPTLERVKKLENIGLIKSYHALLDKDKIGLGVGVFIQATLSTQSKAAIESFVKKIQDIPEIVECHHVTGSADFLLKVFSKDIRTYQELIMEKLIALDEIGNLHSMVILNTLKDAKELPVK